MRPELSANYFVGYDLLGFSVLAALMEVLHLDPLLI